MKTNRVSPWLTIVLLAGANLLAQACVTEPQPSEEQRSAPVGVEVGEAALPAHEQLDWPGSPGTCTSWCETNQNCVDWCKDPNVVCSKFSSGSRFGECRFTALAPTGPGEEAEARD